MNKNMRILSLLLTALVVTGLGGCGSTDNSIESTAPQNSTVVNDQNTEADTDTAEASTTGQAAQTEEQTVEPEPGIEGSDILMVYFSRTGEQYTVACPDATVLDGLAIRGNDCQNDQDSVREKVSEWVTGLGY